MGLLNRLFGDGLPSALKQSVETRLSQLTLPNMSQDLMSANQVTDVKFKQGALQLTINWPYPANQLHPEFEQRLLEAFKDLTDISSLTINHQLTVVPHQTQPNVPALAQIKNIIAVASGKGGVGKSTTSINLALALQQEGARVGILDADIYGPSVPTLLGLKGKPETHDGKLMQPMQAHGLQAMSIGFLIEEDAPMIWRGPMVTQTLTQLLRETDWQQLDYLIIDLPPGTGDVQLTLAQQIPVTGAVIVTTPQDLALIDAKKALKMFEKVNIPVLGIIENMSTHICSQCGHEEAIFGEHGGENMATQYGVEFLGAMPLDMQIRLQADAGTPTVAHDPQSVLANKYRIMAHKISASIAQAKRNYSGVFPKIVVQNT